MNNEQRKVEIRRRLLLRQYPKRSEAQFTDENDHNPLVLANCERCSGRGEVCEHLMQKIADGFIDEYSTDICPVCDGSGVRAEVTHYFDNTAPAIDVTVNAEGWLKCPCCGWKFSTNDKNVWTGRRHKRCGQKINLVFPNN